jgi:hypothetical protein
MRKDLYLRFGFLGTFALIFALLGINRSYLLATVMQPISMTALKTKSSHILLVDIKTCESQWENRRISTTCSFEIVKQYQGDVLTAEKQRIKFWGGEVQGIAQKISGAPEIKPAMQVLVFLQCADAQACQIVGFAQGVFYPLEENRGDKGGRVLGEELRFVPRLQGVEFQKHLAFDQKGFEKAKTIHEILNQP